MIRLSHLTKKYGAFTAVDDLSIDVREGEQADLRGLRLVPVREVTTASRLPETLEDAPSSLSVITARALPDVRDGLKPVHRRIIWDMDQQGFRPNRAHVKSARVTGDTMGTVILSVRCHQPAPSRVAASYNSCGTPCSAAR